jgi:peptide deformylase
LITGRFFFRLAESTGDKEIVMESRKIFTYGAPILRECAKPVESITPDLSRLAEEMLEIMENAPGVGLAAPQVGVSIRMIIVTYGIEDDLPVPKVILNPEILYHSDSTAVMEEGCLSVPDETASVDRWTDIVIRGMTLEGRTFKETLHGLTARIFQHEYDHLEGLLFIDRISFLKRDVIKRRLKKRQKHESEAW